MLLSVKFVIHRTDVKLAIDAVCGIAKLCSQRLGLRDLKSQLCLLPARYAALAYPQRS